MKKGIGGARKGYKIFSFSMTIRNPKRNTDFLRVFKKYKGKLMTETMLYNYFFQLVQEGIYTFSNIPNSIREKLESEILLNDKEVESLIENNPQATGVIGRVMTHLRALKDQGFLIFHNVKKGLNKISLSKLGEELIDTISDATNIYTKVMIGTHTSNPARKTSMFNEAVPFLNTLFVIDEVKRKWSKLGHDSKGILFHEFGTFVLSMKDCDYKKAAAEIIKYRKKYRYEVNKDYILKYLETYGIEKYEFSSIINDYPDEVFRKFEMTGLLVKRGKFSYRYVDFSKINIDKVKKILSDYKNYYFHHFSGREEYYDYLSSIPIPWEKDEKLRRQIVKTKYKILGLNHNDKLSLIEQENYADILLRKKSLDDAIDNHELNVLIDEMKILSGTIKKESKFHDLPEPLRLEYVLALIIGKVYGTEGLVSNIIYGEDGKPLHYAPAGKSDIVIYREDGSYILEPTMQRSRTQLLNNETTNIVRHMRELEARTNVDYRVMMVAPTVHVDVADYFKYNISTNDARILPVTFERVTGMLVNNSSIEELNEDFDKDLENIKSMRISDFVDLINAYRLE